VVVLASSTFTFVRYQKKENMYQEEKTKMILIYGESGQNSSYIVVCGKTFWLPLSIQNWLR